MRLEEFGESIGSTTIDKLVEGIKKRVKDRARYTAETVLHCSDNHPKGKTLGSCNQFFVIRDVDLLLQSPGNVSTFLFFFFFFLFVFYSSSSYYYYSSSYSSSYSSLYSFCCCSRPEIFYRFFFLIFFLFDFVVVVVVVTAAAAAVVTLLFFGRLDGVGRLMGSGHFASRTEPLVSDAVN